MHFLKSHRSTLLTLFSVLAAAFAARRTRFATASKFSRPGSLSPKMMFSAAVSTSTSLKCWWIMPMPRSKASLGERIVTSLPSIKICPPSGA